MSAMSASPQRKSSKLHPKRRQRLSRLPSKNIGCQKLDHCHKSWAVILRLESRCLTESRAAHVEYPYGSLLDQSLPLQVDFWVKAVVLVAAPVPQRKLARDWRCRSRVFATFASRAIHHQAG